MSSRKTVSELSADELLSKLVKGSPKAHITLAGVPTTCTLDTGAETSLIKASFYRKHLAHKLKEVQSLGTYLRVYGAGGLEIPIDGYVNIPMVIHDRKVDAVHGS